MEDFEESEGSSLGIGFDQGSDDESEEHDDGEEGDLQVVNDSYKLTLLITIAADTKVAQTHFAHYHCCGDKVAPSGGQSSCTDQLI